MSKKQWNHILTVLVCWGIVLLPVPPVIHAERIITIESQDLSGYIDSLKTLPFCRGWYAEEMEAFSKPIKQQITQTLKRLKSEFGIDLKAFSNLLTGRIRITINPGEQTTVFYAKPKKQIDIKETLSLLTFLIKREGNVDISEKNESGYHSITLRDPKGVFSKQVFIIFNSTEFLLGISENDAPLLIENYLSKDIPLLNSTLDVVKEYPRLLGDGIQSFAKTEINLDFDFDFDLNLGLKVPLSGLNLQAMIEEFNIPSIGETTARAFTENDRMVSISFTKQDMNKGLCSLMKKGPVSDRTLSWAHKSANSIAAFHVDKGNFPAVIRSVLHASGNPKLVEAYQGILGLGQLLIGLHVENDFLAALGDEMLFLSFPMEKGGGFPLFSLLGLNSTACIVKLSNEAAILKTIQVLVPRIEQFAKMDRIEGGFRSVIHHGTVINYLKLFAGVISPCFVVQDGYLILTGNVPLMRHVLDNRGGSLITGTQDFKKTLKECGGKLGSIFTYSKPVSDIGGVQMVANSFVAIGITAVIASIALPSLLKARNMAQRTMGLANLRQIGLALHLHANEMQGEFPQALTTLTEMYMIDEKILRGPTSKGKEIGYIYLSGLREYSPPDAIVVFDKIGNFKKGRNVLFVDAHVEFIPENKFKEIIKKMLTANYRNNYSEIAVKVMQDMLAGREPISSGREWGPLPLKQTNLLNEQKWKSFIIQEAIKIGVSIDFSLFPKGDAFPRGRKSNFSNVMIRNNGFLTERYTGNIFGSAGFKIIAIATIAGIIAAIAIPAHFKNRLQLPMPKIKDLIFIAPEPQQGKSI